MLYNNIFYRGSAIGASDCFFDSFRQGLEQQKGIKVTVEQLRKDCQEFAQKILHSGLCKLLVMIGKRVETDL